MTRGTGRRHRLGSAALFTLAGILAVVGVVSIAAGDAPEGVTALVSAGLSIVSALFVRLNWQLIDTNKALLEENTRLLLASAEQTDSRPHP